jgi:hypothetical protein
VRLDGAIDVAVDVLRAESIDEAVRPQDRIDLRLDTSQAEPAVAGSQRTIGRITGGSTPTPAGDRRFTRNG